MIIQRLHKSQKRLRTKQAQNDDSEHRGQGMNDEWQPQCDQMAILLFNLWP